ncbi:hypothetical protein P256_00326 [Acinetobacter nectaris CIP 110549]|uniref:Uncharacterized protein n=1 Tax=Acinetobacter nectaris CIP 110549 TaxID=1392540 RepID=V2TFY3_9GAMM|nr:hypothetical protein [Acinetobacter nectaris]ESK40898.1 hypothetical protein P256_00326 [Acinetobacter nectaris CIP 110549]
MKQLLIIALGLVTLGTFTACSKNENHAATENSTAASAVSSDTSPEQQAKIDAIDKPVLDSKNTDVPAKLQ